MQDNQWCAPPPTFILPQPPWAGDATLGRVLGILNDTGAAPQTLIVGGAVRNAVIGRDVADYDLATILTPDQVTDRVRAAGIRAVPTGIDHGTVTVVADGRGFEVTTLRRDIETDGRRAVVSFITDWQEDAARRDFTLNTLLANYEGHVFDPLGTGLDDARAGRVRFVGDAARRIAEDYLRILRFFRFQAHYGSGVPDAVAVAACAAAAPHLRELSRERVTQEMIKWIMADTPEQTLKISIENNILSFIFNTPLDVDALGRLVILQRQNGALNAMSRLLALCAGNPAGVIESLVLSGEQRNFIENLVAAKLEPQHDAKSLRRDAARYTIDVVRQRALMDGCDDIVALHNWAVPEFPLRGHDLMAHGIKSGPEIGVRLNAARKKWIESDFVLTRDQLL